jgi:hypothetical protein
MPAEAVRKSTRYKGFRVISAGAAPGAARMSRAFDEYVERRGPSRRDTFA